MIYLFSPLYAPLTNQLHSIITDSTNNNGTGSGTSIESAESAESTPDAGSSQADKAGSAKAAGVPSGTIAGITVSLDNHTVLICRLAVSSASYFSGSVYGLSFDSVAPESAGIGIRAQQTRPTPAHPPLGPPAIRALWGSSLTRYPRARKH